jgi:hypothetical protein
MRDGVGIGEAVTVGVQPPAQGYTTKIQDSGDKNYRQRILVGTAVTGLVRVEWVQGRYGQLIPPNWSQVVLTTYMQSMMPLRYEVADAQNVIVKEFVTGDYEWLLLWEHDVIPPPNATILVNEWLQRADTPIVSGLYYTRGYPCEPVIYRGRGTGSFLDWKPGEIVWADGVPTGFLLVHRSIMQLMWDESPEYQVRSGTVRRVFETPRNMWLDPETNNWNSTTGTSDLHWCERVIREKVLERAGWPELQAKEWPFPVDTRIACKHIEMSGQQYP